jgi:5-methylcytosine-specific restriction endonuclease McrA
MQADGEIDFRTTFVREPGALRHHPALVLNADYRPLSYYPLSLWPWQEAVKAVWLDRVQIVAEYDTVVRSPSTEIRIPSVVVLRDYIKPQKRVAFTRFNLFLRDEFSCQYCGAKGDLTFDHVVPRARGGVTSWENVVAACSRCNLRKGLAQPQAIGAQPAQAAAPARGGGTAQHGAEVPAQPPARQLARFPLLGRGTGGLRARSSPSDFAYFGKDEAQGGDSTAVPRLAAACR